MFHFQGIDIKFCAKLELIACMNKWTTFFNPSISELFTVIAGFSWQFFHYRIMEFRRTPLAVGRKINLNTEIIPNGSEQLLKTFFVNGKFCPLLKLHANIDK